jgi:hypothetical protein
MGKHGRTMGKKNNVDPLVDNGRIIIFPLKHSNPQWGKI